MKRSPSALFYIHLGPVPCQGAFIIIYDGKQIAMKKYYYLGEITSEYLPGQYYLRIVHCFISQEHKEILRFSENRLLAHYSVKNHF